MYNIGGEGQFIVGGLCGGIVYKVLPTVPPAFLIPIILISCCLGGAIYGWVAGWLYTRRGVEVVISTILLNFVALQLLGWSVAGPLQEAKHQLPQSEQIARAVMLPRLDAQTDFHAGILIALLTVALIWFFLYRTREGFYLKVVGANPRVARANRIAPQRVQERAMLLSGGLCGLAGGIELLGTAGQLSASFSQQWGFLAIPVALLGGLHPLLILASAIYFGALFAGSEQLGRFSQAGPTLVYVIQAVAVFALVAAQTVSLRRIVRREEV
jgi:simple sugar transport system permease protein